MANRRVLLGIGIGVAVTLAAPFVLPIAGAVTRPLTKSLLKQGLLAVELGRERLALAFEDLSDLIAEVRAEVDAALRRRRARPPAAEEGPAATDEAREGNGPMPSEERREA